MRTHVITEDIGPGGGMAVDCTRDGVPMPFEVDPGKWQFRCPHCGDREMTAVLTIAADSRTVLPIAAAV